MTLWLMIVQNRTRTDVSLTLDEVRRIYDELAARPAERQCLRRTECCQFKLTGLTPYLTKGEALVAARAWRATGRKKLPDSVNGACPMLESAIGQVFDLRRSAIRLPHTLLCRGWWATRAARRA